jgi:hypothetical protein
VAGATLAPLVAAAALLVYVRQQGGRPSEVAMLELASEGDVTMVLQTSDGPVGRAGGAARGGAVVTRRALVLATLSAVALAAAPRALAGEGRVPAAVRVIKGSRQGPAKLDPRLEDLKRQLSPLAYVRWEQVKDERLELERGKTEFVELPGGDAVGVTLQERRGDVVTFEVSLTSRNTESRLTVEKGQRIVHQVTPEKGGEALFVTVMAWP